MTKFEIYSILENIDLVHRLDNKQLEDLLERIGNSPKESLYGAINMLIVNRYLGSNRWKKEKKR